jgi:hypothetical protein
LHAVLGCRQKFGWVDRPRTPMNVAPAVASSCAGVATDIATSVVPLRRANSIAAASACLGSGAPSVGTNIF